MRTRKTVKFLTPVAAALALSTACGGAAKPSSKTPADVAGGGASSAKPGELPGGATSEEPKKVYSKDTKADFNGALQGFLAAEKGGWSDSSCRQSAEKFSAVANEHKDLVEASYMAGLSYQRCNLFGEAEKAYQDTLRRKSDHPQSLSNLGDIYFKQGKVDAARRNWEQALKVSGKLSGAHVGLASLQLEQLRQTPAGASWNKLAEEIAFHLSSALAVNSDDVAAYTVYGLFYLEGSERNKNRLGLAKTLLEQGEKRSTKYAPLRNAKGLYFMQMKNLSEALKQFQAAVELDPKFIEARMNVGLTTLNFRKYDTAKEQFTKVLEQQPKNYDAVIGLGIALRGMGDFDGAEAQYKKAKDIDGKRGEAIYNLGVLYMDFKANKQTDLKASIATNQQAAGFFREFLGKTGSEADKAQAKDNIAVIDKNVAMMQNFLKAQAAATPAAPAK